ncbi:hypothetical protein [Streptomyces antimycoticus]|nr:hypothetical protein [Streptomyces antimycoticus]
MLVWADSHDAEPFGEADLRLPLDAYNRENTRPSTLISTAHC